MAEHQRCLLKEVSALIGRPVSLGVYERLVKSVVTEDIVSLTIERWTVKETAREWRIVAHSHRVIGWARPESGSEVWDYVGSVDLPDDSWQRIVHLKYGEPNTPQRLRERRDFAQDCYRPGTHAHPMDSWLRALDGSSTEQMDKHWARV